MRNPRRLALAGLALAPAALLAAGCGGSSPSDETTTAAAPAQSSSGGGGGKLAGTVGPGYTITLTRDGQAVDSLAAGTYEITVDDESSIHGFTLEQESGGSFEQDLTEVDGTGTKTVTVSLSKGEWKFYCPPHESQMNGSFTVT
jgi:plastocyanin